jgi:exosome complex component RRP4
MFKVIQHPPGTSILSLPEIPTTHSLHPAELEGIRVDGMELDGPADVWEGSSAGVRRSVVSPGEVITSSKEYMRCVS